MFQDLAILRYPLLMPFAYPHRPQLMARIIERVAAGERLTHICAQPGMPSHGSILAWRRADRWFDDTLAAAQRRADWNRRHAFDEANARAVLDRVRAGEKLLAVLSDPAMPSRRTVAHWRQSQGEFQGELFRLHGLRLRARDQRLRDSFGRWDPAIGDRILARVLTGQSLTQLYADPAMPGRGLLNRWRREQPEFDRLLRKAIPMGRPQARRRRSRRLTPELTETIVGRIVEGASLHQLGAQPDMPSRPTLYAWVAKFPDFAAEIAQACQDREHWYRDQILMIAETAIPGTVTATRRRMAPLIGRLSRLRRRPGDKRRGQPES